MQRKRFIQVAGNPLYQQRPAPSLIINNPQTGSPAFGHFPAIQTPEVNFLGGAIYLRYGRHIRDGEGYGFEHIWRSRFPREVNRNQAEIFVTKMILSILISGATIHYEFGIGSNRRSTIFKNHAGVVIVEERVDGRNTTFYSIVTAIGTQNAKGSVIGAF